MYRVVVSSIRKYFADDPHELYSLAVLTAATADVFIWVKSSLSPEFKLMLIMFVAIASIPVFGRILAPYGTWLTKHFSMSPEWQGRAALGVFTVLLASATAMGNAFATGSILLSTGLPPSDFPHALYVLTVIYTVLWFAYMLSLGLLVPGFVALMRATDGHGGPITAFCGLAIAVYAGLFGTSAFTNLLNSDHKMLHYVISSSSFVENQGACSNLKPYIDISPLSDDRVVAELPDSYVLAPCKRADPPDNILAAPSNKR